jgi:hypothetical protein
MVRCGSGSDVGRDRYCGRRHDIEIIRLLQAACLKVPDVIAIVILVRARSCSRQAYFWEFHCNRNAIRTEHSSFQFQVTTAASTHYSPGTASARPSISPNTFSAPSTKTTKSRSNLLLFSTTSSNAFLIILAYLAATYALTASTGALSRAFAPTPGTGRSLDGIAVVRRPRSWRNPCCV